MITIVEMELITFAKGLLQDVAEYAAGYKYGQVILRQADKVLWVLEKTARWAVPPPLDQDERPQPELVRPLPWIFFFTLLLILRVGRESISIINLFCGKPPLRSADVVMYIQSKRRYIRALKYQGNRNMRARSQHCDLNRTWMESILAMLERTTCFRASARSYGNNNTTNLSNNEESTKCSKHSRNKDNISNKTMELLIEKMMVNMNTDSDDDSSYTLTNDQSVNGEESDIAEVTESESKLEAEMPTSTPMKSEKQDEQNNYDEVIENDTQNVISVGEDVLEMGQVETEKVKTEHVETKHVETEHVETEHVETEHVETEHVETEGIETEYTETKKYVKIETEKFLQNEKCSPKKKQNSPPKKQKIANGQAFKVSPKRKKGSQSERRDSDVPLVKITPANESTNNGTDVIRRADKND